MKKIFALTLSLAWFVVPAFADDKAPAKTEKKVEPTAATTVEKRLNLGLNLRGRTTSEGSVVQRVKNKVSSSRGSVLSNLRSERGDGLRVLRNRRILSN